MRRVLAVTAVLAVGAGAAAIPSLGASTKTVLVKDDFFKPSSLTISKGTKVEWLWRGKSLHNIAVANGPSTFRASTRRKGHFEHTFKRRGKWTIVCTIHAPDMCMVIRVK